MFAMVTSGGDSYSALFCLLTCPNHFRNSKHTKKNLSQFEYQIEPFNFTHETGTYDLSTLLGFAPYLPSSHTLS